jgi:hypothetical protein
MKTNKEIQFLMYSTPQEDVKVGVVVKDETIWLTQKAMALLFDTSRENITMHLKNIFDSGELSKQSTSKDFLLVVNRGFRGEVDENVEHYNLDAIISVGYRVNSSKATQFRIWATQIIKEYMIKGFTLDDDRLKQGTRLFEKDYFHELLERIRSIRSSERRVWQKITDVFAELSEDYDSTAQITKDFYAMVQNKFHFAITGKTAPEIIYDSADSQKENMGLMTWKNAPNGRILKSDVKIAKNYLNERQIQDLELEVSSYFDYIESLIRRGFTFTMKEFAKSVNEFLEFRKYKILVGKGKISRFQADEKAESEYDIFNKTQKIESDFDKEIKKLIANQQKE